MTDEIEVVPIDEIDTSDEQTPEGSSIATTLITAAVVIAIMVTALTGMAIYDRFQSKPPATIAASAPSGYVIWSGTTGSSDDETSPEEAQKWKVAPKDAPPEKLIIGPHEYTVKYRRMHALGATDREKSIIWLRNDLPPSQLRATMIHEVMHGCIGVGNWYGVNGVSEDQAIEAIAPIFLMVMRDNPNLVAWLEKKS